MKAFGYVRISDEDQSVYSLEFQEQGIRDYCARYNLQLLKNYIDNGQSSYTFDRKAFNSLETELKSLKPQYLIVYHLDRFGRNMAEAMLKVKDLYSKGIKVRDITEPIDLDDEDPNTFMLRAMKFMAAETELHRIRSRTKSGMRAAKLAGRYSGMAPFGYINARDEQKKAILEIDQDKASIVRLIYREYLNGLAIEELRGLASRYGKLPKGSSAIQRVLSNPVYCGLVRVPAAKNHPAKLVKALHTPIISEQDFWLVQERLNGKNIVVQNRAEVPMRGVLHCWCGKKVTAGNSKSKSGKYYWYYLCPEHRKNMPATRLHSQFDEILDHLTFDLQTLRAFKEQATGRISDYLNNREANQSIIRKQLTVIETKIEATEEKNLRNPVSEKVYNKVMGEFKAERSRLFAQLAEVNTNQQAYWEKLNEVLLRLSNIRKEFEAMPLEKKQQFITYVFDGSLFYENECYRTPKVSELFTHNLKVLNEKGLLKISNPVINLGSIPLSTREGS